ncbi:MAG: gamma-glutamylcyclotransferase [Selenomonas sp.]|jgi:gamma-glutamylcyclotransferase (GGCT)/AIG2-like uncharacterized protein YtfP|nr:gamma-glutamylcyclotransferase [Selenomonas sp.]
MKKKIYVAYGSNMDLAQMAHRCPQAELLGQGMMKDWQLLFKGSQTGSYATVERRRGYTVPVLLWQISKADENRLDVYEGFPDFYYKKTVKVETEHGSTKGMVYIMHEERKLGSPTARYYDVLERAYKAFDFDIQILQDAYAISRNGSTLSTQA